jgi:DNA repair exonuclease SbcCD nuclease subunit
MSILGFSDVHLGDRSNSVQGKDGLSITEKEARMAMEAVYERARQSDIDLLICSGDIYHTSHPTAKNIEYLIDWLHRINDLGKPLYIITGNHDSGVYSNSILFIKQLRLNNVCLNDNILDSAPNIMWKGWSIYFVPFISSSTAKDKTGPIYQHVKDVLSTCKEHSIIVTHVYDSDVVAGSEATMIARFTETIDFDAFPKKDVIMLLGHAHRNQIYTKKNGIRVCYPGSLYYANKDDANQTKGYVVITQQGGIAFEAIAGLRAFVSYTVPEGQDAIEFINSIRIGQNKTVFLTVTQKDRINETALRESLADRGSTLGKIKYLTPNSALTNISIDIEDKDHYKVLSDFLKSYLIESGKMDKWDKIFHAGKTYLEQYSTKDIEG